MPLLSALPGELPFSQRIQIATGCIKELSAYHLSTERLSTLSLDSFKVELSQNSVAVMLNPTPTKSIKANSTYCEENFNLLDAYFKKSLLKDSQGIKSDHSKALSEHAECEARKEKLQKEWGIEEELEIKDLLLKINFIEKGDTLYPPCAIRKEQLDQSILDAETTLNGLPRYKRNRANSAYRRLTAEKQRAENELLVITKKLELLPNFTKTLGALRKKQQRVKEETENNEATLKKINERIKALKPLVEEYTVFEHFLKGRKTQTLEFHLKKESALFKSWAPADVDAQYTQRKKKRRIRDYQLNKAKEISSQFAQLQHDPRAFYDKVELAYALLENAKFRVLEQERIRKQRSVLKSTFVTLCESLQSPMHQRFPQLKEMECKRADALLKQHPAYGDTTPPSVPDLAPRWPVLYAYWNWMISSESKESPSSSKSVTHKTRLGA